MELLEAADAKYSEKKSFVEDTAQDTLSRQELLWAQNASTQVGMKISSDQ